MNSRNEQVLLHVSGTVWLLALLLLLPGCATYLGYDIEYGKEGPKTVTMLKESHSDLRLNAVRPPASDHLLLGIQATGDVTRMQREAWKREATRAERYILYSAKEDLLELFPLAWGVAVMDLMMRLMGMPPSVLYTRPSAKRGYPEPIKSIPLYASQKPSYWYLRHLVNWLAWFVPGKNAISYMMLSQQVDQQAAQDTLTLENSDAYGRLVHRRSSITDPAVTDQRRDYETTTKQHIPTLSVEFDLGPAGQATVTTDADGTGRLDLKPYLNYLQSDFVWNIKGKAVWHGQEATLAFSLNTSDLGVTWDAPRAHPDQPPRLETKLDLVDQSKDGVLSAGETATAALTVRNVGGVTAWALLTKWQTPEAKPDTLTLDSPSETSRERLDPGQTWQTALTLRAAKEWMWPRKSLTVGAAVEDLSKREHPTARAALVARSFEPPRLDLVEMRWSDGNDGVLRPGDMLTIRLYVQNQGANEARGVRPILRSSDTGLRPVDPYDKRARLAPAEIAEFVWNVAIPTDWRGASGDGTALPINIAIDETREPYRVSPKPLGLALGAKAQGAATVAGADLDELKRKAQETMRMKSEAESAAARLEAERLAAEALKQQYAEQAKIAQLKRQDEATKLAQQQDELRRKQAEEDRLRQQKAREEEAKIAALREKQAADEAARQTRLAKLKEQRRAKESLAAKERSRIYQLRSRSHALIVGVDEYATDSGLASLRFAVADATALRDALTDPTTGTFDAANVHLLATGGRDRAAAPTRANIFNTLSRLTNRLGPEDRFLFFFAGHGTTDEAGNGNYLLPHDASVYTAETMGIELRQGLFRALEKCRARKQVLIVDACHSGLLKGVRGHEAGGRGPAGLALAAGIEQALNSFSKGGSGRATLASSSRDQVSHEDNSLGHGVFTYYLVEGLRSLAKEDLSEKVDRGLDGQIEAEELFTYVKERVQDWCKAHGRKDQTPRVNYDDTGAHILLSIRPPSE